jgi:hypothetical protein
LADLEIVVDSREQYAYRFTAQQVRTVKRALPCGDYGTNAAGQLVAVVERKSLADLVSSLMNGKLRYALAELAALPRSAVVVEERYSQIFKLEYSRPAMVMDGLAELQVRWPTVPIVFLESRQLAEEWTYRYLAAARAWAMTENAIAGRVEVEPETNSAPAAPLPSTAEVRTWARAAGLSVPARGRLAPDISRAWREAHPPT